MNTQRCQTCSHWDPNHGLEMTNLGSIAPCTRNAPSRFALTMVELSSAGLTFSADPPARVPAEMELPMAIWPYTGRNQICGDYQPCDLEENVRRNRQRAAPLS